MRFRSRLRQLKRMPRSQWSIRILGLGTMMMMTMCMMRTIWTWYPTCSTTSKKSILRSNPCSSTSTYAIEDRKYSTRCHSRQIATTSTIPTSQARKRTATPPQALAAVPPAIHPLSTAHRTRAQTRSNQARMRTKTVTRTTKGGSRRTSSTTVSYPSLTTSRLSSSTTAEECLLATGACREMAGRLSSSSSMWDRARMMRKMKAVSRNMRGIMEKWMIPISSPSTTTPRTTTPLYRAFIVKLLQWPRWASLA